jgi:sortase A
VQPEIPIKRPPTIDDIVGIAFSLTIVFFLIHGLPAEGASKNQPSSVEILGSQDSANVTSAVSIQTDSGLPVHLKIPRINVDAALQYVGLTANGEMDVPENPSNAAWLDTGPRPGEKGTAIIDGHFGWKNDIPAVFDDLTKLQKGDKIYVEDQNGVTFTFVVREFRTYGTTENASDVFTSSDGKAHLNLITCEGVWSKASQSYSNRLVVFTDKE